MVSDIAGLLAEVTREGSISGWKERVLQVVASVGVDLRMADTDGSVSTAIGSVISFMRIQYDDATMLRLREKLERLAAQQKALKSPDPAKVIRKSANVVRIGSVVVDGESSFVLSLNHLREVGEPCGRRTRGAGGKVVFLTASRVLSPLLPLIQPGDSFTIAYLEPPKDSTSLGVVLEIQAPALFNEDNY